VAIHSPSARAQIIFALSFQGTGIPCHIREDVYAKNGVNSTFLLGIGDELRQLMSDLTTRCSEGKERFLFERYAHSQNIEHPIARKILSESIHDLRRNGAPIRILESINWYETNKYSTSIDVRGFTAFLKATCLNHMITDALGNSYYEKYYHSDLRSSVNGRKFARAMGSAPALNRAAVDPTPINRKRIGYSILSKRD